MPTVRCTRVINATPEEVWEVVCDPYYLPRWWPRVARMEGVTDEQWTEVLTTAKGRFVRADFHLLESEPLRRRVWEQELAGTPFERLMTKAVREICLEPAREGTRTELRTRVRLRGMSALGGVFFRRAGRKMADEALESLADVCEPR
jgi:uncharacterized protein YndB with AHSA1/START domain